MVHQPKLKVFLHKPSGQYRKRINGRDHYLGTDHDEAVKRLTGILEKRNAAAGVFHDGSLRIDNLAELFAQSCETEIAEDRLQRKTFKEYDRAINQFVLSARPSTHVRDLRPIDFARVRQDWTGRLSPYAANRYILAVRRMFNWAKEGAVIKDLPAFGQEFETCETGDVRIHNEDRDEERGERLFNATELRGILTHPKCVGVLRACVLLALNTGMYAADCGDLRWEDIRVVDGVTMIHRTRRKTGVRQRAPLWPEVATIIDSLRMPTDTPEGFVFRRPGGSPVYNRKGDSDWVGEQFALLYHSLPGARKGMGFGAFRHTHTTAIGDLPDPIAAAMIRGHKPPSERVEARYNKPTLARLKKITDTAREVLYVGTLKKTRSSKAKARRTVE